MTRRGSPRDRAPSLVLVLSHALLVLACSEGEPLPSAPATPAPLGSQSRIVSLSPLATRFLTQLGAADRIVPLDPASDSTTPAVASATDPAAPLRTADLDRLIALDPDVVFLPALPDDHRDLARLEATGARIVEFAPHDLEDILAFCQGIGTELVGEAAVVAFQRRVMHPVARIAGQAPTSGRLRAIALVDVDPPTLAGGHSYETDLIELAGATSLTHGGSDNRLPVDRATLAQMAPDFVLVMTDAELGPADQDRALMFVGDLAPVVFFAFARDTLWLDEPVRDVERMRREILALEAARASKGAKPAQPAKG